MGRVARTRETWTVPQPHRASAALLLAAAIALAACAPSPATDPATSGSLAPAATVAGERTAAPSAAPTAEPVERFPTIAIVDTIQAPSTDPGRRIVAILVRGDLPKAAVEPWSHGVTFALMSERVDGDCSGQSLLPALLDPLHPDALAPGLGLTEAASGTRTPVTPWVETDTSIRVRPTWTGTWSTLGTSDVTLDGWLTLELPATWGDAFCAQDLFGTVAVQSGQRTATAELARLRVDSRDALDGSVDNGAWGLAVFRAMTDARDHLGLADSLPRPAAKDAELWRTALTTLADDYAGLAAEASRTAPPAGVCYRDLQGARQALFEAVDGTAATSSGAFGGDLELGPWRRLAGDKRMVTLMDRLQDDWAPVTPLRSAPSDNAKLKHIEAVGRRFGELGFGTIELAVLDLVAAIRATPRACR